MFNKCSTYAQFLCMLNEAAKNIFRWLSDPVIHRLFLADAESLYWLLVVQFYHRQSHSFADCLVPHIIVPIPSLNVPFFAGCPECLLLLWFVHWLSYSSSNYPIPSPGIDFLHWRFHSSTECLFPSLIVSLLQWLSHSFTGRRILSLAVSFLHWLSRSFT